MATSTSASAHPPNRERFQSPCRSITVANAHAPSSDPPRCRRFRTLSYRRRCGRCRVDPAAKLECPSRVARIGVAGRAGQHGERGRVGAGNQLATVIHSRVVLRIPSFERHERRRARAGQRDRFHFGTVGAAVGDDVGMEDARLVLGVVRVDSGECAAVAAGNDDLMIIAGGPVSRETILQQLEAADVADRKPDAFEKDVRRVLRIARSM